MELKLTDLRKTYGNVKALKGINYTFKPGIYGLLGANGAGKSTMINLITDNVKRDRRTGEAGITFLDDEVTEGKPVDILTLGKRFRAQVGYMPQQQGFYEDFSAKAFVKYMAQVKGIKPVIIKDKDEEGKVKLRKVSVNEQVDRLLEIVNLTSVADKRVGGFSGGMKQRVLLAQALLGDPKILILDEPTAGLDPKERINLRNYIDELSKNKIIIFSTHVVSDIESIADKIIILKDGEIVADGTVEELIDYVNKKSRDEGVIDNLEAVYMYYFKE